MQDSAFVLHCIHHAVDNKLMANGINAGFSTDNSMCAKWNVKN